MVAQSKCFIEDRPGNNNVESRAKKSGLGRSSLCNIPHKSFFRIATFNVSKTWVRFSKLWKEHLEEVLVSAGCRVHYRGSSARFITKKDQDTYFSELVTMLGMVVLVWSSPKMNRKGVVCQLGLNVQATIFLENNIILN